MSRGSWRRAGLAGLCLAAGVVLVAGWYGRDIVRAQWRGRQELPALSEQEAGWLLRLVSLNCAGHGAAMRAAFAREADIVLLQETGSDSSEVPDAYTAWRHGDLLLAVRRQRGELLRTDAGEGWQSGVLALPGGDELQLINVHLHPPCTLPRFWQAADRAAQAQAALQRTQQLRTVLAAVRPGTTKIIGGDFNALPTAGMFDLLRPEWQDAYAAAGRDWGGTVAMGPPLLRLDQFWCDRRLTVRELTTVDVPATDHRALFLAILVPQDGREAT